MSPGHPLTHTHTHTLTHTHTHTHVLKYLGPTAKSKITGLVCSKKTTYICQLWNTNFGETKDTSKEIKPVNFKGNQPWILTGMTDAEAEAPILWPPDSNSQLIGKDPNARKDWRQKEKRAAKDEMVGWHHQFNGHELGWTPGYGEGLGGLECYSPQGHKESDTT